MTSFIKSIDAKAWRAIKVGWKPPMVIVDGKFVPKTEEDQTNADEQDSLGNSCILNVIYNGVDLNVFKLINSCITTKDA